MKQLWKSGMDPYSKNPGLCLCSTWGPNWIWAWMPPNSPALSKDTGWEPFRMSSRAWKTKRKPLTHFEALPSPVSVSGTPLTDRLQGRRVRPARKADWAGPGLGSPRSGPSRRTCVWAGGSRSRPRPALWTFCCGPASSLTTGSTATGVGLYKRAGSRCVQRLIAISFNESNLCRTENVKDLKRSKQILWFECLKELLGARLHDYRLQAFYTSSSFIASLIRDGFPPTSLTWIQDRKINSDKSYLEWWWQKCESCRWTKWKLRPGTGNEKRNRFYNEVRG